MFSGFSSKHVLLSVACLGLLSGCSYMDTYSNAMPTGYVHHNTKPISEPSLSKPYDSDIVFNYDHVQKTHYAHKDKVDQLLEQIKPTLRTITPGDSIFLVSEQKNRDFDDALRLSLRNLGQELDLTSMARYQMIYTVRKAKKEDFEGMSIQPESAAIKKLDYYDLSLVDTSHGSEIASAYLIPNYYGFKVPEGYEPVAEITTPVAEKPVMDAAPTAAVKATPVMDDSPMLAHPEEVMKDPAKPVEMTAPAAQATVPTENASYNSVYSADAASNTPMAITDGPVENITAQ